VRRERERGRERERERLIKSQRILTSAKDATLLSSPLLS